MSSQVNKSSVRFKPRAGRRVRLDSTTRRNSTTTGTPQFSAAELSQASESAIADDDFKVPESLEKKAVQVEEPKAATETSNVIVEASVPAQSQPLAEAIAPTIPAAPEPAQDAVVEAKLETRAPVVPTASLSTVVNPNFDLEESGPEDNESLFVDPGKIDGVPQPVLPIGSALIVDEDEDSDREVQYDEQGNTILEPKDVMRLGRTNAKMHFDNRVINAESFTMSALCNDIPIGEKNKEYHDWEAGRSLRKRQRTQLLLAKRMVRGKYNPKRESKRFELLRLYKDWQEKREREFGASRDQAVDIDTEDFAPSAPQALFLQKDAEGNFVLDEKSIQVDRHQNNRADEAGKNAELVNDKFNKLINSASHRTKERPERWSEEETSVFYDSLSAWGTDFNLISQFFPQRTRTQIKTKFKYEEKRNPQKVQMYLVHRKKVSLTDVARVSGKPIVDISDIEADLEAVRKEHAVQLEKEQQAREDAEKEDAARKAEIHSRKRQKKGITGTAEVVGEVQKKEEADEEADFDGDDDDYE